MEKFQFKWSDLKQRHMRKLNQIIVETHTCCTNHAVFNNNQRLYSHNYYDNSLTHGSSYSENSVTISIHYTIIHIS